MAGGSTSNGWNAKRAASSPATSPTWPSRRTRGSAASTCTYGPDGSVYVLDWSDIGECHEHDGVHRRSGRIFRIAYGPPQKALLPNLPQLSPMELAKLHTHANEWYVRQARRELANRAAVGADLSAATSELRGMFDGANVDDKSDAMQRLRALWTLYTLGALDRPAIEGLLDDRDEFVRTWGVRLMVDFWPLDTVHGNERANLKIDPRQVNRLAELAKSEPQGPMRLVLASSLQRLPPAQRPALASALSSHAEDASDHNLPKMVFFGLAPLVESDPASLVPLAAEGQFPLTREWLARALAEDPAKNSAPLAQLLAAVTPASESVKADVLRGLAAGLAGRRKADPPEGWTALAASLEHSAGETQELVRNLNVVFGDGRALDEVRRVALDSDEPVAIRRSALETLIEARPDDLRVVCERLLRVRFLNTTALAGLTLFDDPEIGVSLARNYRSFHPTERGAVIETLASRPAFAAALLDPIGAERIPREDLTALHARQIRNLGDEQLTARLAEVWGELRDSPRDKQELIDRLKAELIPTRLAAADLRQGRAVYQTTCANCHRLFGTGGTIGPDLTGSGRHNLDYLLGNIVDPSAIVNKDYRMSVVRHADGRVLSGIICQPGRRAGRAANGEGKADRSARGNRPGRSLDALGHARRHLAAALGRADSRPGGVSHGAGSGRAAAWHRIAPRSSGRRRGISGGARRFCRAGHRDLRISPPRPLSRSSPGAFPAGETMRPTSAATGEEVLERLGELIDADRRHFGSGTAPLLPPRTQPLAQHGHLARIE